MECPTSCLLQNLLHSVLAVRTPSGLSELPSRLAGAEFRSGGDIEKTVQPQQAVKKDFRELPILFAFVYWWLYVVPAKIIFIIRQTIKKLFVFFSIDLLLRSLFQPWKRDEIDTTNMSLQDKLRVMMMNLVSRLVGAVVRSGTVIFGLVAIILTFLLGVVISLGIIFLPAVAIIFLIVSIV